jgi:hypothetical protein
MRTRERERAWPRLAYIDKQHAMSVWAQVWRGFFNCRTDREFGNRRAARCRLEHAKARGERQSQDNPTE